MLCLSTPSNFVAVAAIAVLAVEDIGDWKVLVA
jgi:hypothetical protein